MTTRSVALDQGKCHWAVSRRYRLLFSFRARILGVSAMYRVYTYIYIYIYIYISCVCVYIYI